MKLKLDAAGNAVLENGMPVYVHDDGREVPFDAPGAMKKIGDLNREAKTHREKAESLGEQIKAFQGLGDPAEAAKLIEVAKNIDAGKLLDAQKVELIKSEMNKSWEERLKKVETERDTLNTRLIGEVIGGSFARSTFINDKTILPSDVAYATFSNRFKIEGNSIRGLSPEGDILLSRVKPGEPADFEEAIELMITSHPQKDRLLKPAQGGGAATPPGGGTGGKPGSGKLTRAQFDQKSPSERASFIREGGSVVD